MVSFGLELLQAINDWQLGGDHEQKVRRGEALKAAAHDLPSEFKAPPFTCYRREAHDKDRVWQLLAENKLPETIASWTLSLDVARAFKRGIPREPLKGVIFRITPIMEQVVVNLDALYAEPLFTKAIKEHQGSIKHYRSGIGKYQGQQREVVLELGSLEMAAVHLYGGYSGTLDQLIAVFEEEHGATPDATQITKLSRKAVKPYWLSEDGTHAMLERVLGKAEAARWWGGR